MYVHTTLFINLVLGGALAGVIIGSINIYDPPLPDSPNYRPTNELCLVVLILSSILLAILWFIRLLTTCYSRTGSSLFGKTDISELQSHFETIRNTPPQLFIKCQCYYTDSDNNTVITYTEHVQILVDPHQWVDESRPIVMDFATPSYLSIYFTKQLLFDDYSLSIKEFVKDDLRKRNQQRDSRFKIWEEILIDGYKEEILFSNTDKASIFHPFWYFLSNLFLLFFFYEAYYDSRLHVSQVEYIKRTALVGYQQILVNDIRIKKKKSTKDYNGLEEISPPNMMVPISQPQLQPPTLSKAFYDTTEPQQQSNELTINIDDDYDDNTPPPTTNNL